MPLTGKETVKLVLENGWVEIRQGEVIIILRKRFFYLVTISVHGNEDLGRGLERKILKDLGL